MTDEKRDPSHIRHPDGTWRPIETVEEACAAAFRGAWRGLASQGWKPSARDRPAGVPQCLYNGPEGRHCAAGWLLVGGGGFDNDAPFGADMLHVLAQPLAAWAGTASASERAIFVSFVVRMQRAHDDAAGSGSVYSSLDTFRREHGYPIPGEP